jgi:hypothetical protein
LSQAAAHARDLKTVQDKLQEVTAELAVWKSRFYMVAAALAVALFVLVAVLFKVLAAPVVLTLVLVGVLLLCFFYPDLLWSLLRGFKWMWQNPVWAGVIIAIVIGIARFRKRILKRVFGDSMTFETLPGLRDKIKDLERQIQKMREDHEARALQMQKGSDDMRAAHAVEMKRLTDDVQAKDGEISNLRARVAAGGGSAAGELFSPPSVPGASTPVNAAGRTSDTPARGISP